MQHLVNRSIAIRGHLIAKLAQELQVGKVLQMQIFPGPASTLEYPELVAMD
jgi:hypothetical protein